MDRQRIWAHESPQIRAVMDGPPPRGFAARPRRVGAPGCPGAPLTEPDLWATHPALRSIAVGPHAAERRHLALGRGDLVGSFDTPGGSLVRPWPIERSSVRSCCVEAGSEMPTARARAPARSCRSGMTSIDVRDRLPSSPSSSGRRFGPGFPGLAVLRGHPTSPVPSPPRPFVLGGYRLTPEAGRSPWVRRCNFRPTPSPVRTPDTTHPSGFAVGGRLTLPGVRLFGASLAFGSAVLLRLPLGAPSRALPCLRIQVIGAPSLGDLHPRLQRHARRDPLSVLPAFGGCARTGEEPRHPGARTE
jgi:hypothetical protein